jgi:hypothetical protein
MFEVPSKMLSERREFCHNSNRIYKITTSSYRVKDGSCCSAPCHFNHGHRPDPVKNLLSFWSLEPLVAYVSGDPYTKGCNSNNLTTSILLKIEVSIPDESKEKFNILTYVNYITLSLEYTQ